MFNVFKFSLIYISYFFHLKIPYFSFTILAQNLDNIRYAISFFQCTFTVVTHQYLSNLIGRVIADNGSIFLHFRISRVAVFPSLLFLFYSVSSISY